MNVSIRSARPTEVEILSAIARSAKAHWGYPPEWLETWAADLIYTSRTLQEQDVIVAESEQVIGVGSMSRRGPTAEVEGLWVCPEHMGRGVGRRLFEELARRAHDAGASMLRIVSDPHAEAFYRRMGALPRGTVPSRPEGRRLTLLVLALTARHTE